MRIILKIFVSYAWKTETDHKIVDDLEKYFRKKWFQFPKTKLIVDRNELRHGDSTKKFMEGLAKADQIVTVFSDAYFKSQSCMFELLEIKKHGNLNERTYPIVTNDCKLQEDDYRIGLTRFWQDKYNEKYLKLRELKPEDHKSEFENLKLLEEISEHINDLLNFAKARKYVSLDKLKETNYSELLKLIYKAYPPYLPKAICVVIGITFLTFALLAGYSSNKKIDEKNNVLLKLNAELSKLLEEKERSKKDIDERLSMGERSFIDAYYDKRHGNIEFRPDRYQIAGSFFSESLNWLKDDPEARIYLNNAKIISNDNSKRIIITIAVSVPIRKNITVSKEILRGIAQAQEVNNRNWSECLENHDRGENCTNIRPLQVMILSDDNEVEVAERIANYLVNDEAILAVIGHNATSVTKEVYKIYQSKLVMITPTSYSLDHTKIEEESNYIYGVIPPVKVSLVKLIDYIVSEFEGKRTLLFCTEPGAHDKDILKKPFQDENKTNPGKINFVKNDSLKDNEECNFGDKMKGLIDHHMKYDPTPTDIFLSSHVKNILDSIILARENRKRLNMFSTLSLFTRDVLSLGGEDIEGMVLAVNWHTRSHRNKLNHDFLDEARRLWDDGKFFDVDIDITWRTAMAYDATNVILEGLKRIPRSEERVTRKQLQERIANQKFSYDGITGKIEFKENGERKGGDGHVVQIIKDKDKHRFMPLEKMQNDRYEKPFLEKAQYKNDSVVECK